MKDDIFLETKVQVLKDSQIIVDLMTQKRICYFPRICSSKDISDARAFLNSPYLDAQIL